MNILFINTSKSWGGNEKWTFLAAHALSSRHNVHLAYRSHELSKSWAVPIKKRFPFYNRFDCLTLFWLARYLKKNKIDIVVSTNRKYFQLGGLAARLAGCKHFVRCGIVWSIPNNVYYKLLFTKLIDGILVNAFSIKDELLKTDFIAEEKVHVIYNAVDMDKLDRAQGVSADKPFPFTVISSGELVPRKGFGLLIESFAQFLKAYGIQDAGLIIIGKGRQENELKTLSEKHGIADKTIFTGWQDNPYPLLCQADLFVSLSRNEGISNALLEAMYLKVPIISTSAGGTKEIVSHGYNGFLVERADVETLVVLYKKVYQLDQLGRNNMVLAARETVLEHFSTQQMVSSLEEVFRTSKHS